MLADLLPRPIVLAVLALLLLGYAATCSAWPYRRCGRCRGLGYHRAPVFRIYRQCRRCNGSGMSLRLGRRAWNLWTRLSGDHESHKHR